MSLIQKLKQPPPLKDETFINRIINQTLAFIGLVAVLGALLAFPTKWLWNSVVVHAIHARPITAWQALGLVVLCAILFRNNPKACK